MGKGESIELHLLSPLINFASPPFVDYEKDGEGQGDRASPFSWQSLMSCDLKLSTW